MMISLLFLYGVVEECLNEDKVICSLYSGVKCERTPELHCFFYQRSAAGIFAGSSSSGRNLNAGNF